ncbi:RNA polymerase sigma factor [Geomicrobium sp. JCM 19038]|uniref:RNA polymerase sigma factor n=1 Tax=Geomicrobium sp. JCM 19038 TaxID=1460635 RepID=UPI00045F4352|nr:RNA polymerase sigma factor [Geomicrobium sp. JCM 19038]GAK06961.1 hypothetical protein JCM19038_675 [Geomicrobium sp. JCM 19038]
MEWQETYESLLKYCQTLQKGDKGKDLAQEAVAKIIATNPKEITKAYAKRTAKTIWIDAYRKDQKSPKKTTEEPVSFARFQALMIAETLVHTLTKKQQVVYLLKEGFCYRDQEIAELLACNVTTVKALLRRARAAIHHERDRHGIPVPVGMNKAKRIQYLTMMIQNEDVRNIKQLFHEEDPSLLLVVFFYMVASASCCSEWSFS